MMSRQHGSWLLEAHRGDEGGKRSRRDERGEKMSMRRNGNRVDQRPYKSNYIGLQELLETPRCRPSLQRQDRVVGLDARLVARYLAFTATVRRLAIKLLGCSHADPGMWRQRTLIECFRMRSRRHVVWPLCAGTPATHHHFTREPLANQSNTVTPHACSDRCSP